MNDGPGCLLVLIHIQSIFGKYCFHIEILVNKTCSTFEVLFICKGFMFIRN